MINESFWIGGFECSCHRRRDGKRLDLVAATRHDRFAAADYARLKTLGIGTARDGVRWHSVETAPGRYDFSSLLPLVRAAREAGVQVIWDLCHYGYPDGLDVFRPQFVDRFARYARAVARLLIQETGEPPAFVPINEISFWSWASGDAGYFHPCETGRGFELKAQLVRASLAAIDALWEVDRRIRILHTDPAIHIVADPRRRSDAAYTADAEGHRLAQYQAWDLLTGRLWPQLGGDERYLQVLGVNYYPNNQWILHGPAVEWGTSLYRPFREILREIHERYGRPLLISETGAQDGDRPGWLRYIGEEVRAAGRAGVPVEGICLYPVVDYPGWDDDRYCASGLWSYTGEAGERETCEPMARELERQRELFQQERSRRPVAVHESFDPANEPGVEELEHAAY